MITIPTSDFTGILADVIPFATNDDELPETSAVRLEWSGRMLEALATDRYRIGCSQWEPGDIATGEEAQDDLFTDWGAVSGDEPWGTTLHITDAAELAKVFKLPPKEAVRVPLTVDYDRGRDRLKVVRARETSHSAITIVAEGVGATTFPDLRGLLAKMDALEEVRGVAFTARLLADFAKVRPRGPLQLRFTGATALVHVAIGDRFYGAIMPVRSEGGDE